MVEYLKAGFFYITIVSKWLSIEIEITVELFNIIHYYIIQHYSLLHYSALFIITFITAFTFCLTLT